MAFFEAFSEGFPEEGQAEQYFIANAPALIKALLPDVVVSPRVVLGEPKEGELGIHELDPMDALSLLLVVFNELMDFTKLGELSSFREDGPGPGNSADSKDVWDAPK